MYVTNVCICTYVMLCNVMQCMYKMIIYLTHIHIHIYILIYIRVCVHCTMCRVLDPFAALQAPRLRTGVMALLGCSSATSVAYLARLDRQMVSDGLAGGVLERDKMDCNPVPLYVYIYIYIIIYNYMCI